MIHVIKAQRVLMQHSLTDINIASVTDVHFAVEMSKFNGIAKPYRKCICGRTKTLLNVLHGVNCFGEFRYRMNEC